MVAPKEVALAPPAQERPVLAVKESDSPFIIGGVLDLRKFEH